MIMSVFFKFFFFSIQTRFLDIYFLSVDLGIEKRLALEKVFLCDQFFIFLHFLTSVVT